MSIQDILKKKLWCLYPHAIFNTFVGTFCPNNDAKLHQIPNVGVNLSQILLGLKVPTMVSKHTLLNKIKCKFEIKLKQSMWCVLSNIIFNFIKVRTFCPNN